MKVVHIAYQYGLNNTGGAAVAATRLHLALHDAGVESHYVTVRKFADGPNVHVMPRGVLRPFYLALTKLMRGVWKFSSYRRSVCLNLVPLFGLERLLKKINPEVVHVQWINADVMSFEQLGRLRSALPNCRFVFNLHDLFMIDAMGYCPGSDTRYIDGFTRKNATWMERVQFMRKKRAIGRVRPVFVGPSQWVVDCCRRSLLGKTLQSVMIPNRIDSRFSYDPVKAHHSQRFVVLFGAYGGRSNGFKGFVDLEQALALLPLEIRNRMELRIFGESAADCLTKDVETHFKGNITDPDVMVRLYHEADVLAFPSREETQGMTKVEALLCGLPVVAFRRTGCAEGIVHQESGWVAENVTEFARGIEWFFRRWEAGLLKGEHARIAKRASAQFDPEKILAAQLRLYRGEID